MQEKRCKMANRAVRNQNEIRRKEYEQCTSNGANL
jgi:hypothetical protein